MKKWILSFVAASFLSATAFSQAVLPTSYDFETSPAVPVGWTTNTTSVYGTGVTGVAGKLNADQMHFTVNFLDEPGDVTYYLRGWIGGTVTSWVGTFTVEESVDGVTWTTMRQFVDNLDHNNYVQFTDSPLSTTRYIRWYYTDKQSGANVGIDDVTIALPVATPAQEINCVYMGNNAPSGSQISFNSPVSTMTPINITIENLGTVNTLNISGTNVTGPNAGEFVVSSAPSSITALGSQTLTIDFTPTVAGTRLATLEIANDDANENPYIINLYGVGGNFATEPASPPTGLTFSNIKSYRFQVDFTGSGADNYLVVRKVGSAVSGGPVDGTTYVAGDAVGDGKVAYAGPLTSFMPNNIIANTDYYFDVYAYNGFGQYTNYLESSPLSGNTTSGAANIGSYYSTIVPTNATFATDLGNLINPHNWIWYGDYDEHMIKKFESRDTTGGQKVVTGVYSGENYVYSIPFTWDDYSREHSYPHSWMPTEPADNPEQLEYNDLHHLFPTNFTSANAVRLNYPFGEVVNVTSTFMGATFGEDANGNTVYEPRDEHKGDAARALFYMCTAYDVEGVFEDWSLPENISIFVPYGQDELILKQWHYADPPSNWEIARNDFIDSIQTNRNPFVDNPDWVCYINFADMTYISNPDFPCNAVGMDELEAQIGLEVFPNPNNGEFQVNFNTIIVEPIVLKIVDVTGKTVYTQQISPAVGQNTLSLDLDLAAGMYELELSSESFSTTRKVMLK